MKDIKCTKTKTVLERNRYHLSKDLKLDIHFKNGKKASHDLVYTGKKVYDYQLAPLYRFDREILKTTNPYWGDYDKLKTKVPITPEQINIDVDITYCQGARHAFFDVNKEPIPVD
jgi:hypothetical protein